MNLYQNRARGDSEINPLSNNLIDMAFTITMNLNPSRCKRTSTYLKLNKALYGLKQAPKNWYETLTGWLESIGFKESLSEPCMYICNDGIYFIFFHVDDLVLNSCRFTAMQLGETI
ncbi:hypothetical protein VP01_5187g1 [Puccinia sorghi]|uniref:Reverse transcriptase Ty1/copia-type domain-containing protein n=1 Tax=Puccinia sorghi TaxID=27349 RepID=A0A0L6UMS1_9BASI|nr:hypothetical protein VP01_5187g1 [Puccinia sorghi]